MSGVLLVGPSTRWAHLAGEMGFEQAEDVDTALGRFANSNVFVAVVDAASLTESEQSASRRIRAARSGTHVVGLEPVDASAWDEVVTSVDLKNPAIQRAFRWAQAASSLLRRLGNAANTDALTGVLNRRGLAQAMRQIGHRADGRAAAVSVLVDLDDFKRVNDRFGIGIGDRVLQQVAGALVSSLRAGDVVARVGGDEFLLLLWGARMAEASEVVGRVKACVFERARLPDETSIGVSMGLGDVSADRWSVGGAVAAGQEALDWSKRLGRPAHRPDPEASDEWFGPVFVQPVHSEGSDSVVARLAWRGLSSTTGGVRPRLRAADDDVDWAASDHVLTRLAVADVCTYVPTRVRNLDRWSVGAGFGALIDEGCIPGDPADWIATLSRVRDEGVRIGLDIEDFGKGALECVVLWRPDLVVVDERCAKAMAARPSVQRSFRRFVAACDALEVPVAVQSYAERAAARAAKEAGARLMIGVPDALELTDRAIR